MSRTHFYFGRSVMVALLCSAASVVAPRAAYADGGVIEFSDEAPPPNDADQKQTAAWKARADKIVDLLTRMSDLLSMAKAIGVAADAAVPTAGIDGTALTAATQSFAAARSALFSQADADAFDPATFYRGDVPAHGTMWSVHDDQFAGFVAAGLGLQAALAAAAGGADPEALSGARAQATGGQDDIGKVFDTLLAEQAVLNKALRYYPNNTAGQAPLACDFVNHTSRIFVCVPKGASGAAGDSSWAMGQVDLGQYCIADGGQPYVVDEATGLTLRIRRDFNAVVPPLQIIDARVNNPVYSKWLGVNCP